MQQFQPGTDPSKPDYDPSIECRPPAIRFSKEIIEFANKKYDAYAAFYAPIVAALTLQNILIMCLMDSHEPGDEGGLKAINTLFDKCKFDASMHWRSQGLKNAFAAKKKIELIK